jgi:hypothetical protein
MTENAPDDWGDAPGGAREAPHSRQTDYVTTYRFFKRFQLQVLLILICFVILLLIFEAVYAIYVDTNKQYAKDFLLYVLPLFTFVLGMGSKSRDED